MIQQSELKTNYSSNVELYLKVGNQSWELASIERDFVTPRDSEIELEKNCRGEVVMLVDGQERRWKVIAKRGPVPFDTRIPIISND
jgi:hypothetical protein